MNIIREALGKDLIDFYGVVLIFYYKKIKNVTKNDILEYNNMKHMVYGG